MFSQIILISTAITNKITTKIVPITVKHPQVMLLLHLLISSHMSPRCEREYAVIIIPVIDIAVPNRLQKKVSSNPNPTIPIVEKIILTPRHIIPTPIMVNIESNMILSIFILYP